MKAEYWHIDGSPVDQELAERQLELAWAALTRGVPKESWGILAQLQGRSESDPSYRLPQEIGSFLLQYDYPALQQLPEDARSQFALATTWHYLLGVIMSKIRWEETDSPLAAILSTSYILDFDFEALHRDHGGEYYSRIADYDLPVPYGRRDELFPELRLLPQLSLAARKIFVDAMLSVWISSGLVQHSRLLGRRPTTPVFENGLAELIEARLIDPAPTAADWLMNSTTKTLKQFAFKHGISSHGPKWLLIEALLAHLSQEELKELLDPIRSEGQHLRLLITDLPLLKKFVRSEVRRVRDYISWIIQNYCLPVTEPRPSFTYTYHAMEPWGPLRIGLRTEWTGSATEKQLVTEFWDDTCDDILRRLARKCAWYTPLLIIEAIEHLVAPVRLKAFKRACEFHQTQTSWELLQLYGELRLVEMNIRFREPRALTCPNCGLRFREWSVHVNVAKRVGFHIYFCYLCYSKALWDENRKSQPVNRSEMLICLAQLATALGSVPTATFVQQPVLALISQEKQIATVKALISMPSYKTYMETFGSWLTALVLAGVLADDVQRTMCGTRCLATDGHECLSIAEKSVDDWLSAHGIPHEIEPYYPYHPQLNPTQRMRADWLVGSVFIEYAGLMDEPEYSARIRVKQDLAAKLGFPLIVIKPADILGLDEKLAILLP